MPRPRSSQAQTLALIGAKPLTMRQLAGHQGIEEATAQRKLKALLEAGLIERFVARDPDLGAIANHFYRLTNKGRDLLADQHHVPTKGEEGP